MNDKGTKIIEVARKLGVNPNHLDALINFETAGTYDPLIASYNPASTAKGLIQINDPTAKEIFGTDSASLVNTYRTFDSQMDHVVVPYFKHRMKYYNDGKPLNNLHKLSMAVFYPAYVKKSPYEKFPKVVSDNNENIYTPNDYVSFVKRRLKKENLQVPKLSLAATILLIAAGAIWYLTRRK